MFSKENIDLLKKEFNIEINQDTIEKLNLWHKLFIEYNSHTNLMSAGDIKVIFEKHVFDSLAILKWSEFDPYKKQKILDVGTGGGFPSIILALFFPELEIVANDSRMKKINFIIDTKAELNIKNLKISYARVEDLEPLNCDIVVSRAVGTIKNVLRLSKKHIKENGYFVIYKSKTLENELNEIKNIKAEIITYNLPLKENFERHLAIIKQ